MVAQGLGSIIMEITYSRAIFFFFLLLLLNTCSFHTETAEREAGSQEEAQSLCHREFQQAPAS